MASASASNPTPSIGNRRARRGVNPKILTEMTRAYHRRRIGGIWTLAGGSCEAVSRHVDAGLLGCEITWKRLSHVGKLPIVAIKLPRRSVT